MTALGVVRVCVLACPPEYPVIVQTLQCGVDRSDTMHSSSVDQALQYIVVWIGLSLCSLSVDQILWCGMDRSGTVHSLTFTVSVV